MKVQKVEPNNHKRAFDLHLGRRLYEYPYAACDPAPSPSDRVREVYVDPEVGHEGFSYVLESGLEGTVLADHVLDYHEEPRHMAEILLYKLTVEARKRVESTSLGKRALARRLGTSVAQIDRLLDTSNCHKSIASMIEILAALGCSVDIEVKNRQAVGA